MTGKRAFTLVELLVVIVIIGILVSISVVSWSAIASRGRDSTRKSDLARIKQILNQYHSDLRTYPAFDLKEGDGRIILSANWQLNGGTLACSHGQINSRLTPFYVADLPSDPRDIVDYTATPCNQIATPNQTNRYIYISGPTTSNDGPAKSPTDFGLLATLERPGADAVENQFNPFHNDGTATRFGPWYRARTEDQGIGVNANYLITN